MTNKLGMNIEAAVVQNMDLLEQRARKYRWSWSLTFDVATAKKLKEWTGGQVVVRKYPDGGVNEKLTPTKWMDKFKDVKAADFWCAFTNEMGLQTSNIIRMLPTILKNGYKVTLPVISSGTPEPEDWYKERYEAVFNLFDSFPGQVMFDVHEYIPFMPMNDPTWNPDKELPSGDWWYNGRFETFGYKYLDYIQKAHVPYIVSELGAARENGTIINPSAINGYPSANGWHSYLNSGEKYFEMLAWLVDKLYNRPESTCQGVMVYCYGADWTRDKGSEFDWSGFDVERDASFWLAYDNWFNKSGVKPMDTPVFYLPALIRAANNSLTYFHPAPQSTASGGAVIGSFRPDVDLPVGIDVFGSVFADNLWWLHIKNGAQYGYASFEDLVVKPPTGASEELQAAWDAFNHAYETYKIAIGA